MRKHKNRRSIQYSKQAGKPLCFEPLEHRRMLATMADIIFLMDESGSNSNGPSYLWLKDSVFASTTGQPNPIAVELAALGINNVRYGLVGFGASGTFNEGFAHSYIVNSGGSEPLYGDAAQLDSALDNVEFGLDGEDGWDAFEHVISEYDFREGAVPLVVLLQNKEGRNRENVTLTRDGILAGLESKNVIVDTMTYGLVDFTNNELFDLSFYQGDSNIRILGVEADQADGIVDGQHDYVGINTSTGAMATTAGATTSQALQVSFNGSNTGVTGMVGSAKSILFSTTAIDGLGPSTEGYRATSVPFETVDMSSATVRDDLSSAITLPTSFTFYGNSFSKIWVSEDGTVRFGNGSDPGDPGPINVDLSRSDVSGKPTFPMIAGLWDDLAPQGLGQVLTKVGDFDSSGQNDIAIEWKDYRYDVSDESVNDGVTFQLVLYAGGQIRINYQDLEDYGVLFADPANPGSDREAGISGGVNATVGLWNGTADPVPVPSGKFVPGLHSVFGSHFLDFEGNVPESNDRYVRLAWDTGGAAWDLGVVDGIGDTGPLPTIRAALRDQFLDSLGSQIVRQAKYGKTFQQAVPLLRLNVGGSAVGNNYVSDTPYVEGGNAHHSGERWHHDRCSQQLDSHRRPQ